MSAQTLTAATCLRVGAAGVDFKLNYVQQVDMYKSVMFVLVKLAQGTPTAACRYQRRSHVRGGLTLVHAHSIVPSKQACGE